MSCSLDILKNDCYFASGQADAKLKEEEKRALRYLETRRECNSVEAVSNCVIVYSLRLFQVVAQGWQICDASILTHPSHVSDQHD